MSAIIILIIIVGTGLAALTVFTVRRFLRPRRVGTIARLLRAGKPQAAVRLAKQILAHEPRNPDAHFLLSEAYLADGKAELALMELKIINQLGHFGEHCREIPFRRRAAELYRHFRQPEEALKEYLLLIQLEPTNPENPYQAGQLFEDRQMSDKAAALYRRAVQADGQHIGARLKLGALLHRQKRPAEAQRELEAALRLDPDNTEASFLLGRTLKTLHDYPGALRALEKAQRDPELKVKALIEAGTCHLNMNNLARAIPVLERAASLSGGAEGGNDGLYARYFLALACEKSRDLEKAIVNWEAIFARNPAFRDVAQKLNQYQELRVNDRMKDFLTCSAEGFLGICREILGALKLEMRDVEEVQNGLQMTAVEAEKNYRATRPLVRLVLILRVSEMIDIMTVRAVHERMKKDNLVRGIIITSSNFTRRAGEFAETRPIELFNQEKLSALLQKMPAGT